MRPGGPGKRMRGRNRGGKGGGGGGGNPMQRSYESNGPDVKIRGTAQHVAEKYAQLARDTQASDDHVLAESYLQHAEHYYRMIAAYQAQFAQQGFPRTDEGEAGDGDNDSGAGENTASGEEGGDYNARPPYRDNRFHRNTYGRPENTEQPPVAFPLREETNVPREEGERGPRRFDKRDHRPPRDRNQGPGERGNRNEAASSGDAELPSFLTRTRRRSRPQDEAGEESANNNRAVPPASEA